MRYKLIFSLFVIVFFSCQYFVQMSKDEWNKINASSSSSGFTASSSKPKEITSFSIISPVNASGIINGTNISITVPYGTTVTNLIAVFTTSGTSVQFGSTVQISGTTANNFSNPVTYTVTAVDGTTKDYTVAVTVAASNAKAITAFSFSSAISSNYSAGVINDCIGTISGTNISVNVPYGTNVTALIATFTTSGASVQVNSTTQTSGSTPNNFSSAVTYTVTAADSSTQNYTITISFALNTAKDITAFSFMATGNSLAYDCPATISGTSITVSVPRRSSSPNLIPTFTTTGASVMNLTTTQIESSGSTTNDFSSSVVFQVTAANGSTKNYTITVTFDDTAPVLTITGTPYNDAVDRVDIGICSATDSQSGIASYSISGNNTQTSGPWTWNGSASGHSITMYSNGVTGTLYTFNFTVTDNAGNSTTQTINFTWP
jgi:trimeric autotransporter adhesin